jgi:PIN domain
MKELHVLVDYENVQPTIEELAKLAPGFTDIWLFHGPHQAKQTTQFAETHERVTPVPRSGNGPNALDFHLSFYLGYVAAKHPDAHLVVVANDKGYDPMIAHARMLNFTVKRVGHKAKPPAAAKKAATPKAAPAVKKVAAKKTAPVKPVAPQKSSKTKVSVPVKNVPAKKIPAKKVAPKKSIAAKSPVPKVTKPQKAAVKQVVPAESKEFLRIKKGLTKMGDKAPTKRKSFLSHVKALLGKDATSEQLDELVQKLQEAGVVQITGEVVSYNNQNQL